ncbi:MAG TPA: hypothetical protein VHU23_12945 [Rhizomicrobium sp.]|jgi:hypothetical protein|nr:hypothetical protein [Rhizomicrobium sp.]
MPIRAIVLAILATLVCTTIAPAEAAPPASSPGHVPAVGSGSCSFRTTEIATASAFDQSTSSNFVKLRDAGLITFEQAKAGCVAGTFFANAGNGDDGDHILLQVLLDGTPCAPFSNGYIFANSGSDFSSHSAAFFCGAKIAAGKHAVQVEYASGLGGNAEIFQRTLEVSHE